MFVCSAARCKGRAETEARILDTVEREILHADLFSEVLDLAMQRLARQSAVRAELISERQRLERELANLAAAVATGGDVPHCSWNSGLREARKRDLEHLIGRPGTDLDRLRETLAAKLDDWRRLLRSRPITRSKGAPHVARRPDRDWNTDRRRRAVGSARGSQWADRCVVLSVGVPRCNGA